MESACGFLDEGVLLMNGSVCSVQRIEDSIKKREPRAKSQTRFKDQGLKFKVFQVLNSQCMIVDF